ncbi:UNVERIFIED_CONTAM: c-Myc-binding protein [Sesamum radiatum]|uniref:c-Myc-binding protein n=1 Tax=Sesamum radiatum TaxID=300843 RepID=A0AAW2KD64_SESRA
MLIPQTLFQQEKEAKKEALRKYLESSGVLDALTKVLVALYEQNDKPSSSIEFIQQKLGGPTLAEYEKLQAEVSDLQIRYNELLAVHRDKCREVYSNLKFCSAIIIGIITPPSHEVLSFCVITCGPPSWEVISSTTEICFRLTYRCLR